MPFAAILQRIRSISLSIGQLTFGGFLLVLAVISATSMASRIAITLAMLVALITAKTSRKPPKVNWPIESEIDRIRWRMAAKGMGSKPATGNTVLYAGNRPQGNHGARALGLTLIRRNPGVLDHLGPQRHVGLD